MKKFIILSVFLLFFSQLKSQISEKNNFFMNLGVGQSFSPNGHPLSHTLGQSLKSGSIGLSILNENAFVALSFVGKNRVSFFYDKKNPDWEKFLSYSIFKISGGFFLPSSKVKFFAGPIAGFNLGLATTIGARHSFLTGVFFQINANFLGLGPTKKTSLAFFLRPTFNYLFPSVGLNEMFNSSIEVGLSLNLGPKTGY